MDMKISEMNPIRRRSARPRAEDPPREGVDMDCERGRFTSLVRDRVEDTRRARDEAARSGWRSGNRGNASFVVSSKFLVGFAGRGRLDPPKSGHEPAIQLRLEDENGPCQPQEHQRRRGDGPRMRCNRLIRRRHFKNRMKCSTFSRFAGSGIETKRHVP